MAIIKEIGRHVRALSQKLTADNIHNFGQKAMQAGHVLGRKVSNTLHKSRVSAMRRCPALRRLRRWQVILFHLSLMH